MRKFWTILVIGIMLGCNTNKNSKAFELIDISIYQGGDLFCLKINKIGICNIYNYDPFGRKHYFDITLTDNQLDSVSKMVNTIKKSRIDSVYDCPSDRYGSEVIVIKTADKYYRYFVSGSCYKVIGVGYLQNLTRFLYDLADKSKKSLKGKFIYESYSTNLFPPLPPPPSRDLIKETKFEKMKP